MWTVSPYTAVAREFVSGPLNSVFQFLAMTGPRGSLARTGASGENGAPVGPNARGALYDVGASEE